MTTTAPLELECVTDPTRAAVLLQHPLRKEILARAGEPVSATELAAAVGVPRQRLNYHVQQLVKAGFLRPAGRRMRRNLVERHYMATAKSYVLSPQMLGPLAAAPTEPVGSSSAHLLQLSSVMQRELTTVLQASTDAGVRVRLLSTMSALHFRDAGERAEFGRRLSAAIAELTAGHEGGEGGSPDRKGRPYRLVLGFYPVPDEVADSD
ncbi:MAG: helix-turn-helix domain-containing protein [Gemmatimonadota bacterium]